MPGTFSKVYIQVVFTVKGRDNLISKKWKAELKNITPASPKIKRKNKFLNGVPDQSHAFIEIVNERLKTNNNSLQRLSFVMMSR